METKYETKIYFVLKAVVTGISIILFTLAFTICLCVFLKTPIFWSGILITIAFLSPLIYAKKLKSYFTYSSILIFNDIEFKCQILRVNKLIPQTFAYKWDNIQSYKFQFPRENFTSLVVYSKSGKRKQFLFLDNKTGKEEIEQNSIFGIFRKYVKNYNKCEHNNKIMLMPGFFATRLGAIVLWIITLMAVVAMIDHIFKPAKSIGFLIVGICALFPLWVKRNQDKKFYERMSKLDEEMKPL